MSKIIDHFHGLPQEQQEKVWMHLKEWSQKVYEPLSLKRSNELSALDGGNVIWKLKELIEALEQKDVERVHRVHMTLPSIGVLASTLKEQTAAVLFKRAFIGFNQSYAWTFALCGQMDDESLAAGVAVGVLNHYMRAHPMGVREDRLNSYLEGEGGYWPKVPQYHKNMTSEEIKRLWDQYRGERSQKVEVALEHYKKVCEQLGYTQVFSGAWGWLDQHCSLLNNKISDVNKRLRFTGSIHNPKVWGLELPESSKTAYFNSETVISTEVFEGKIKPRLFALMEQERLNGITGGASRIEEERVKNSSNPQAENQALRKVRFL